MMDDNKIEYWKITTLNDLADEVWANIPGIEGEYMISNLGRLKSIERTIYFDKGYGVGSKRIPETIKTQTQSGTGYLRSSICINGKVKSPLIHRLVALTFIPNHNNKPEVNHINGDKTDNRIENLEWATKSENGLHSFRVLGRKAPIGMKGKFGSLHHLSKAVICINTGVEYGSIREAVRKLNLSEGVIREMCYGVTSNPYKTELRFKFKNSTDD